MLRVLLRTARYTWYNLLYYLLALRTSITTLWTLGFIADTSLLLDDDMMENRYDFAEGEGDVSSHTAPLVFLGKCGAGKTSLSLTLRHQPLLEESDGPPKTLGLEETLVEVSYVDMRWREFRRHILDEMNNSEYIRALLFYVAAAIDRERQSVKNGFHADQVKLLLAQAMLTMLGTELLKNSLPFGVLLLICCGFYRLIHRSHHVYFIMGYGNALSILSFNYIFWSNYTAEESSIDTAQFLVSFLLVFITFMMLGLGTGEGVTLALCVFNPRRVVKTESITFGATCLALFFGHVAMVLKSRRQSVFSHAAIILICMTLSLLVCRHQLLWSSCLGFLFGYVLTFGLECGQMLAPKLSIGGNRNIFLTQMIGFVAGCFGIAEGFGGSLQNHTVMTVVSSIVSGAFSVSMLWAYHKTWHSQTSHANALQNLLDNAANPRKPARIALIDCAGDEVYRDAQHVYMTPFSTYIIVFRVIDIDEDNSDCDATYWNLSQWLNSVAAHVTTTKPCVYLVATHKATPAPQQISRSDRLEPLQRRLRQHYGHMLVPVPNNDDDQLIFQVENLHREENEDLELLRQSIVHHMKTKEVPLVWFTFLDMVQHWLRMDHLYPPLMDVNYLYDLVEEKCELRDLKECRDMLEYFNDCGEIFYDPQDVQLSSYVLLDRRLLVDIVRRLMHPQERPKLYFDREELHQTFGDLVPQQSFDQLTAFLHALNFLIPMQTSGSGTSFWVPFNLPPCPNPQDIEADLTSLSFLFSAEFDFCTFHPSPLFLRLLSLCEHLQDSDDAAILFRNVGRFSVGPLRYLIVLGEATPGSIRVSIFGAADHHGKAVTLVHQLTCLVRHLCHCHFRSLKFSVRLQCEVCSKRGEIRTSDVDGFPFRTADQFCCECAGQWPRPLPPDLTLSSGHVISFRFATDVLLLSHGAVPKKLLETFKRLTDERVGPALQLWTEGQADDGCHAARIAHQHLEEAQAVVVLVTEELDVCAACQMKVEALWRRKMGHHDLILIPILMEEETRPPQLLNSFKSLTLAKEEDWKDWDDMLKRVMNMLRKI